MKRFRRMMAVGLVLPALLWGCVQENSDLTEPGSGPAVTVGDIFTEPTEETRDDDIAAEGASWTVNELQTFEYDEIGAYLTYDGGEMKISLGLNFSGMYAVEGMAVLMFVNGQVQPYRVEGAEEYKVFYTQYDEANDPGYQQYDLYFVPAAGKAGEMASLNLILLSDPDFSYSATGGPLSIFARKATSPCPAGFAMYRIKMNADAAALDVSYSSGRIISMETQYNETTYEDIEGWTDEDLRNRVEANLEVNGRGIYGAGGTVSHFGIPAEQPLELHLEIWGRPGIEYAIIPFVNNEPIYLDNESVLSAETRAGEKTVIDISLDISDTNGETQVFVYMIPLNVLESTEVGEWMAMRSTPTVYLLTMSREEIIEKTGQN